MLDHVFSHLNIDSRGAGRVNHPIVMTEALCNPNYCREGVNELMFECYGVPSVSYAVDALCSYYHSQQQQQQQQQHLFGLKTGLILSISHRSTHIIPVTQPNACDVSVCHILAHTLLSCSLKKGGKKIECEKDKCRRPQHGHVPHAHDASQAPRSRSRHDLWRLRKHAA